MSDRPTKIGRMANYTYRAEYSPDFGQYVGHCLEFPSRHSHASSAHEAIEGAERIVAAAVADMLQCGEAPPPSLTDRRYSGNFVVRTSPQLHARLVVEANEQSVSLNQWAVQKLANRPLRIDDLF